MNARHLLVLLLAAGVAGCSVDRIVSTPDRIITGLGLPQRGFATNALFPEGDSDRRPAKAGGCESSGCAQAPQFCVARGYAPGTASYDRCLVSVTQNLRRGGP
ncbi:MAG: hypothetical protein WDN01_16020 [Rhizomicrobium sp.]